MRREEAVSVLREIIDKCQMCDGNWVALMPPNSHNLLSVGYQVHLKIPLDQQAINCIEKVLKEYDLRMMNKREQELLIIYRPKSLA